MARTTQLGQAYPTESSGIAVAPESLATRLSGFSTFEIIVSRNRRPKHAHSSMLRKTRSLAARSLIDGFAEGSWREAMAPCLGIVARANGASPSS
jgi:hypothetical protein